MNENIVKALIGDIVEFYNTRPFSESLYGIIVTDSNKDQHQPVRPNCPCAIWRPKDLHYRYNTGSRILKVIRNFSEITDNLLLGDSEDDGTEGIHDFFCLINEAKRQGIPYHMPYIRNSDKKWIQEYVGRYPRNCNYIVNEIL